MPSAPMIRRRPALWSGAALALLASCTSRNPLTADAAVSGDRPDAASGLPGCVRGVRETACAWPAGTDAAPPPEDAPAKVMIDAGLSPDAPVSSGDASPAADAAVPDAGFGRAPAKPVLKLSGYQKLSVPLHPELDRRCARSDTFIVSNEGDNPLSTAQVSFTRFDGFTITGDTCSPRLLSHGEECGLQVCFTSTIPGRHETTLTVGTNGGDVQMALVGEVLPATPGLDPRFGRSGAVCLASADGSPILRGPFGATLLNNDSTVALWDGGFGFQFVSAGGPWAPAVGNPTPLNGSYLGSIRAVRAGGPGQGIYALVAPGSFTNPVGLIRFFDDGTRDLSFAGAGAVDVGAYVSLPNLPYGGIQVQASGRVLVIGTSAPLAGVRAFSPGGQEDQAYRTTFPNQGVSAIDDGGRLYVTTVAGVVRLGPDGGLDPGFTFTGAIEAMTVDRNQRLLVAAAGGLRRLDDAGGVATAVPLESQPELTKPIAGIDVDATGRILLTPSGGTVLRYLEDGRLDARLGFADGGAREVVCPRAGGCSIAGTVGALALAEDYVLRLSP